jgi:hypothetical protein
LAKFRIFFLLALVAITYAHAFQCKTFLKKTLNYQPKIELVEKNRIQKNSNSELTSRLAFPEDIKPRAFEVITFAINTSKGLHSVRVYTPQEMDAHSKSIFYARIEADLALLPLKHIELVEEICFLPEYYLRTRFPRPRSTPRSHKAGGMVLESAPRTIYLSDAYLTQSPFFERLFFWHSKQPLLHEFGHLMALKFFGKVLPDQVWLDAAKKDHAFVTPYARRKKADDFAETLVAYLVGDAGQISFRTRQNFKNRFEILDQKFELTPEPIGFFEFIVLDYDFHTKTLAVTVPVAAGIFYYLE